MIVNRPQLVSLAHNSLSETVTWWSVITAGRSLQLTIRVIESPDSGRPTSKHLKSLRQDTDRFSYERYRSVVTAPYVFHIDNIITALPTLLPDLDDRDHVRCAATYRLERTLE
ncbi:hypothetical protein J6590_003544 [Homalodisca vitripennis]|nr:hypothetical protein J6590_003544 [Homalodisca vitripennis]